MKKRIIYASMALPVLLLANLSFGQRSWRYQEDSPAVIDIAVGQILSTMYTQAFVEALRSIANPRAEVRIRAHISRDGSHHTTFSIKELSSDLLVPFIRNIELKLSLPARDQRFGPDLERLLPTLTLETRGLILRDKLSDASSTSEPPSHLKLDNTIYFTRSPSPDAPAVPLNLSLSSQSTMVYSIQFVRLNLSLLMSPNKSPLQVYGNCDINQEEPNSRGVGVFEPVRQCSFDGTYSFRNGKYDVDLNYISPQG